MAKEMNGPIFFGEIDRNEKGQIKSEYPAYYFETQTEELQSEIREAERRLARLGEFDIFELGQRQLMQKDINQKKKKYNAIVKSKPKLKGVDKDKIYKTYKALGQEIKDALFTKSSMSLGTASPHEEAKRMTEHEMSVQSISPEMAASLNLKIEDGKVSRTALERTWKICGKILNEATNVEVLRRDRATFRGRGGQ